MTKLCVLKEHLRLLLGGDTEDGLMGIGLLDSELICLSNKICENREKICLLFVDPLGELFELGVTAFITSKDASKVF